MEYVVPTRPHHFLTHVLLVLVIFQLVEFAYSLPYATQPKKTYCDDELEPAVETACGTMTYNIKDNTKLASDCCTPGCTKFQLRGFCRREKPPGAYNR